MMVPAVTLDRVERVCADRGWPCARVGDVLMINGDALAVLPELKGVADLLLTDWPYRVTSGGMAMIIRVSFSPLLSGLMVRRWFGMPVRKMLIAS